MPLHVQLRFPFEALGVRVIVLFVIALSPFAVALIAVPFQATADTNFDTWVAMVSCVLEGNAPFTT